MLTKAVSFELSMTDCLEQSTSLHVDLVGQLSYEPLTYRYTENPGQAEVIITCRESSILLRREDKQRTEIEFNPDKVTQFLVSDAETQLGGHVETLKCRLKKIFYSFIIVYL